MTLASRRRPEPRPRGEPEPLLRAILDAALDAFILIDAAGVIRQWNRQAEQVFGWDESEAIGRTLMDTIIPARYHKRHAQGLARFLATGRGRLLNRRIEITGRHRDGRELPIELTIAPLRQGDARLFSAFVRDISERKETDEALQATHKRLRDFAGRMRSVREQERALMARQIHDELGQVLTALGMDVAWLEARLPAADGALVEKCRAMAAIIEGTIGRVRTLATELRPAVLDDLGLLAAIEWETQQFTRRTGIACALELPATLPPLDADRSTDLFRILQEALTNVVRHAAAHHVDVQVRVTATELVLVVGDDGRGIGVAEAANPRSLGLLGMRERALLWNGTVDVRAQPQGGTAVTVQLPLSGKRGTS